MKCTHSGVRQTRTKKHKQAAFSSAVVSMAAWRHGWFKRYPLKCYCAIWADPTLSKGNPNTTLGKQSHQQEPETNHSPSWPLPPVSITMGVWEPPTVFFRENTFEICKLRSLNSIRKKKLKKLLRIKILNVEKWTICNEKKSQ